MADCGVAGRGTDALLGRPATLFTACGETGLHCAI